MSVSRSASRRGIPRQGRELRVGAAAPTAQNAAIIIQLTMFVGNRGEVSGKMADTLVEGSFGNPKHPVRRLCISGVLDWLEFCRSLRPSF